MVIAESVLMVSCHLKLNAFIIILIVFNMELTKYVLELLMDGVWVQE